MKSTGRLITGALVTLALTGVAATAEAYPSHVGGHAKSRHQRVEHDGSSRVLRALGRLDRQLVRATRDHRLAALTDADRAALQDNAAADEATVEAVATAYSSDPSPTSLAAAKEVLHGFRAVRYVRATNILRDSERTAATIVSLQPLVAPGSDDEADLAAAAAVLGAVAAGDFTATTDPESLRAARGAVARAHALVGQVKDDLGTG
jgi:hypothetical protein